MIEEHVHEHSDISAFQRSKKAGQCNGDSYYVKETSDYFICVVADGLGSGQAAREASLKAVKVVEKHHDLDVESLMSLCNQALFQTRGAVITLFKFYFKEQKLEYCGIGNIRLMISAPNGTILNPLSKTGFLSGRPSKFSAKQINYQKDSMFIVHSDGIDLSSVDKRIVLKAKDPRIAARYLQQKGLPNVDDLTCVIGKIN
ncbi:PP2C family serine/threonine-protein phosphatase [Alkalihalobacillus sp. AL-G]|uniref:PP2C family serine/threonine-protein phosphatase n=1 Tax=Alkalihalobacillus sp. AL-G TaxID=2926399 RepID=UPI00272996A7|nr:PP2C family serine/threonine-protein phosphatase [Alkalihalobacillus sp. AL-G]WLD93671.1 SpoIIE family protein phosphatase [Alkalihalobacillus sp. AL-G]